jgi:hypothetical protein
MLNDGDDLLNQLSCELGLSDFIMSDNRTASDHLYDNFLPAVDHEENTLFDDLIYTDGTISLHLERIILTKTC